MRKLAVALASSGGLLLVVASCAAAAPAVDGHFPIPGTFDTNSKIVAGPDGDMWMTVKGAADDVARISPAGKVDEFELPGVTSASGIAPGPEGKLWVTQIGGVASFSPADPKNTGKATPIIGVNGNASIVAGPDGQMWVATDNQVFHFPPAKPEEAKALSIPLLTPHDIDVAGQLLVIADANNNRIVKLTTAGVAEGIALLGSTTTSQGVAGSPGGQIAFSKSDGSEGLGLVTPPGAPTAFEMPGDPFGVARGSDEAFWFAMSADDSLRRLTPGGQVTTLKGFPPEFFPRQIAAGPGNTLWVTMEIPGIEPVYEVARVSGLEPPARPEEAKATPPDTRIVKGPKGTVRTRRKKAAVRFSFSSPTAGATFECAVVRLPKAKGKSGPKPRFRPCASPKKLKLRPGKYRFSVRAVAGGLTDPSPARRAFRIVASHR